MRTSIVNRYGVSACAYSRILVMAAKVEWTANDYAAQEILAKMISESGLSLRAVAQRTDGIASHVRIGDIVNGSKGPVRLSEFLAICAACKKDADVALQQILDRADAIEKAQNNAAIESDESDPQWIADHLADYDFAAKRGDTEAEQQAYEDLP